MAKGRKNKGGTPPSPPDAAPVETEVAAGVGAARAGPRGAAAAAEAANAAAQRDAAPPARRDGPSAKKGNGKNGAAGSRRDAAAADALMCEAIAEPLPAAVAAVVAGLPGATAKKMKMVVEGTPARVVDADARAAAAQPSSTPPRMRPLSFQRAVHPVRQQLSTQKIGLQSAMRVHGQPMPGGRKSASPLQRSPSPPHPTSRGSPPRRLANPGDYREPQQQLQMFERMLALQQHTNEMMTQQRSEIATYKREREEEAAAKEEAAKREKKEADDRVTALEARLIAATRGKAPVNDYWDNHRQALHHAVAGTAPEEQTHLSLHAKRAAEAEHYAAAGKTREDLLNASRAQASSARPSEGHRPAPQPGGAPAPSAAHSSAAANPAEAMPLDLVGKWPMQLQSSAQ